MPSIEKAPAERPLFSGRSAGALEFSSVVVLLTENSAGVIKRIG
jgi:hypothetical protein